MRSTILVKSLGGRGSRKRKWCEAMEREGKDEKFRCVFFDGVMKKGGSKIVDDGNTRCYRVKRRGFGGARCQLAMLARWDVDFVPNPRDRSKNHNLVLK